MHHQWSRQYATSRLCESSRHACCRCGVVAAVRHVADGFETVFSTDGATWSRENPPCVSRTRHIAFDGVGRAR